MRLTHIAGMDLAGYMTAKKLDDAQMGVLIGKSRSRVSLYRRRLEAIPSETVVKLVELSAGDVDARMTSDELLGIKLPQAAE